MSSNEPILEVNNLGCLLTKDRSIFHDVSFRLNAGDVLILQGKSGSGKSTLLKCLAHLIVYDGEVLYRGKAPKHFGIPNYRTHVLYVPQRPSLLPGTPRDFLNQISSFGACKARLQTKHNAFNTPNEGILDMIGHAIGIASEWGVDEDLWDRPWSTLSGGEAQRIALAAAVGLDCAEVLLLDEPTSALDSESSVAVENYLTHMIGTGSSATKALIWITHSADQGHRVGTRFISLADGTCQEQLITTEDNALGLIV